MVKTLVLALLLGGCLRATEYHCADDTACSGGTCQPNGYCSFADPACDSGQRFGDSAGASANTCVGDTGLDGGIDASADAAPPDGPPASCPASYAAIPGGQGNHVYRLVPMPNDWSAQRTACAADGATAHLAIPDDATELGALTNLFNQTPTFWIGITDAATENTFLTVTGAAATFLPWAPGQPNDTGNSDCVEVNRQARTFNDTRCNEDQRAVCECEP